MSDHDTMPPPASDVPFVGVSMFYASGDMAADPDARAKACVAAGAQTGFLLVESVEGTRRRPDVVAQHAVALRARNVAPWLFTFPTSDRIETALDHAKDCAEACGVWLLMLDIEPWKDADGVLHDWTEAQIKQLVDGARARGFTIAITVFSRAAWSRIDWVRVAPGVVIVLQVYERVRDPETLEGAVALWPHHTVVLAIGTYVGDIHRLQGDLQNARPYAQITGALAVWVLHTTSADEADGLHAFAAQLPRAA